MGGIIQRLRAPLAGALAVVLVLGMVYAGLRFPVAGWLRRLHEPAGLDYSAPPPGGFTPLRAPYIRDVLGSLPAFAAADGIWGPRGAHDPPAAPDLGPEIVEHALTNDDAADAYTVARVPFTARSDSTNATRDGPADCAELGTTVWYRYRAPSSGGLIAGAEALAPTSLAVYPLEAASNGPYLACDTDARGKVRVTFTALEGADYLFQVTSQVGGPFTFSLEPVPTTSPVSVAPDGSMAGAFFDYGYPQISPEGRYVAFVSSSPHLDPRCAQAKDGTLPCAAQVYVHDLVTGSIELASLTEDGGIPASYSTAPSISADGRYVAWMTQARGVTADPDVNFEWDVFLRDRREGTTRRISVGRNGNELDGGSPSLSADGRYVTWDGDWDRRANPAAPGTFIRDVYWKDLKTGRVIRASDPVGGGRSNHDNLGQVISPDGRYVMFMSRADNLSDGTTLDGARTTVDAAINRANIYHFHIWTYDVRTGELTPECVTEDGAPASDGCWSGDISMDGAYSVFWSAATNLVDDLPSIAGASQFVHLFRRHRASGKLDIITVNQTGDPVGERWQRAGNLTWANRNAGTYISWDGSVVAFDSPLSLVPGDTNGFTDVYIRDVGAARTFRLSEPATGLESNGVSLWPALSADGHVAAFISGSNNFSPRDHNGACTDPNDRTAGCWDVFVRAWGPHA